MAVTATKVNGQFQFSGRAINITQAKNKALEPYNCIVHDYGITLELLPDAAQKQALAQQIGNARFMRNHYLSDRKDYYKATKKTLSVAEYKAKYLQQLKKDFPFLQESDKFALEAALEHVDAGYKNFFAGRAKFPKFVSKWKPAGNSYTTKYTNGNIAILEENGLPYVKLPKVGKIRFVLPKGRTIPSLIPEGTAILSAVVKRETNHHTVSLQLEAVIPKPEQLMELHVRDILAADMGIKRFAIIGGQGWSEEVKNPRWIRLHAKRLRRLQQSLSRKQYDKKNHKGSKNWEKAKKRVAAEQRKVKNQRKYFQHKLSRKIADRYSAFLCEDLNIKGMVKNRKLAKEISSASWGQFFTMVKYKLQRQGKWFIQVDRWYPSSQTCSCCGHKNPEVKDLAVRAWTCPQCGARHDRDENAKDNIFGRGVQELKAAGVTILP